MIAECGDAFAWLGGWRGTEVWLWRPGDGFRLLADLFDGRTITPQRRVVLGFDALFVLEPAAGPVLAPPLRVRRLSLDDGREIDRAEGEPEAGNAPSSYFRAEPDGGAFRVVRYGIEDGRAVAWEGRVSFGARDGRRAFSGTPVRGDDGAWWYPVRMEGLYRVCDSRVEGWRGEPGAACRVGARVACAGVGGLWVDGAWRPIAGSGRIFERWRPPLGRTVAARSEGFCVLRPGGGSLPVLDAAPARLPEGCYTDLVEREGKLLAVATGDAPKLVPVL